MENYSIHYIQENLIIKLVGVVLFFKFYQKEKWC